MPPCKKHGENPCFKCSPLTSASKFIIADVDITSYTTEGDEMIKAGDFGIKFIDSINIILHHDDECSKKPCSKDCPYAEED